MTNIHAIILAAGESKRMKEPKMLLPFRGKTIIENVIENVTASDVDKTVVVLGSGKDEIIEVIGNLQVMHCFNDEYRQGMLSSVKCGLRTLPKEFDAVIILPGDQPMIGPEIINLLIEAYRKSGKGILIPVFDNKRGHPLLVSSRYREEIAKLDRNEGLRALAGKFPHDVLEVAAGTPDILRDIDTPEDYEKELKQIMKKNASHKQGSIKSGKHSMIPRRDFFRLLGGGILIIIQPWQACKSRALPAQEGRTLTEDFNAFLHIAEDGTVSCFTGKIEMGQGPVTALAQMMADELDVPFESVKMIMGDTDLCPWDGGTWGSTSIREFGPSMRAAAAEARTVLMQLGSEQLGVPVTQLEVKNGVISDKLDRTKNVSYARLAKGRKIERHLKDKPALKDPDDFNIIGKPYFRQDARLKVTGEAIFTGDIRLPGMLHARIVRPPSHGAKLVSVDLSEAEKINGIQVVRDGDFIALLHEDRDTVDEAIVKVKAEYSFEEMQVDDKTIFGHLLRSASRGIIVDKKGNIENGRQLSETVLESEFHNGYVAHATIEPHTAAAKMDGDKITVWASAQTPFLTQEAIAEELGFSLDKVRVIVPFVGGGFGGKGDNPQAVEAARIARLSGKPVMLAFTRQEEFFYDTFRSAAVVKIVSGIDANGKITLWDFSDYFVEDRGSDTIYDVPHSRTTVYEQGENNARVHVFTTGPWRAPGNNTNTWARELQITLMASKAGMDPLEFRLKNLKDEKMIAVLKAAADKFGYKPAKGPSGRGFGIACGTDVDTWVAHIAEVEVDKDTGHVQVIRVACAQNMGLCVNPQGSAIQMEGCITMGMGYALTEEVQFVGGKILNQNYDTYQIPRFSWVPKIDTVILDRKDEPPHGGGEPAIICMGGVIASGIFDATGAILYQMPMTPARVLEALKKV